MLGEFLVYPVQEVVRGGEVQAGTGRQGGVMDVGKVTINRHSGKMPAAQGISRLLGSAGFTRSNHGKPGIGYHEVSTGFVCWETFHGDHPEQPCVSIPHYIEDMFCDRTDEGWSAYLTEARARLEDYAGVIRAAGYHVLVRDRGTEPPRLAILTIVTEVKVSETFELWFEKRYPNGLSSEGEVYRDDMEAAWNAGHDAGHAEAASYLATGRSVR